jgi:hypothetical protein
MALKMNSINNLQQYFNGVIERSEHHAPGVTEVIYPLLCLIISRFDPTSNIEVKEYNGAPANMLWVHINGTRYAFRYDHKTSTIEIREGTSKGVIKHSINNTKSIKDLIQIFDAL